MGLKMKLAIDEEYTPEISRDEYEARLVALHKKAFSSEEQEFDKVMRCIYKAPAGFYTTDPQLIYGNGQWHLYYVTGKTEYADLWLNDFRKSNFASANQHPYEEVGDGHAVGDTLFDLHYHGKIMTSAQGEFCSLLQGDGYATQYGDKWVYVVSNRGPKGQSMGLAYSADLFNWVPEENNPIWLPPDYAAKGKCAGAFIVPYQGRYLIYYMLTSSLPINGVGLISTADFLNFDDHGLVFIAPSQLRGTAVIESPCVVFREGIWHLFFGNGTGWWHVASDRPDNFLGKTDLQRGVLTGMYSMGHFHASRVVQTPEGKWYMYSTRKEEQRRVNRKSGISAFRGSKEDESSLLDGIFAAELVWDGDFPRLLELEL